MHSHFSYLQLFVPAWAVASQAPLSFWFFRQEYWSGLPCPPPGDFPHPAIEPISPATPTQQAGSLSTEPPGKPHEEAIMDYKWPRACAWWSVAKSCPAPWDPDRLSLPGSCRLLCLWTLQLGKNTGVGCHFLLQGIFPTQGLNPCLVHGRQILYHWASREAWCMHSWGK